ncbi:reverse transcriptase domain-containing protein [Micromonospora sp. WMMD961]|uniref:reverse transcriptase domain-containing protein n=1 Tax=Micromonospora sp. WMMD961 TaxID=3016100 RepID=UPI0024172A50|nr:reverse transcriptase domain-containing protein [Micromonospora sp. WMMD961]MDG4778983.1 reverse transcriptase domain-containing protein [Micromonospora sp. WMMD961]
MSQSLPEAVRQELSSRNRLLPRRWDYVALSADSSAVERWLRPRLRRGPSGRAASVVFADKGWRGARPLHVMTLEDRVLYRALVGLVKEALPDRLRNRESIEQFRAAPLDVPSVRYISKTDVTAYYEFVDHELLCAELVAQTGEELAVESLADLLASVIGRRVGLPQVHPSSDVLGDSYIDPVRRRLLRRGHATFTYSDDFRIASRSLGEARKSLEACAMEVHALGLVLNERKTYTYGMARYRESLTSFAEAERRLFEEGDSADSSGGLGFLDSGYGDADGEETGRSTLGASPANSSVDEDDAFTAENDEVAEEIDARRVQAAQRAWELWEEEDESEETQAGQDAAITQSLLGRALLTLGVAGDNRPLKLLSALLRYEPALTPQVAAYLDAYGRGGRRARTEIRSALDQVVSGNILSTWQGIWIAHAAGGVQRATRKHAYEDWLARCVADGQDGLAATAAASLGRIGRGDAGVVASAVDRVGPEWRRLAFWGLIGLDRARAESTADDELDRLLMAQAAEQ